MIFYHKRSRLLFSHAGSDINVMETDKAIDDDPSAERVRLSLKVSSVTLNLPILAFQASRSPRRPGYPSARDMYRNHRGHCSPRPECGLPGLRSRSHRRRGHHVGCHTGACTPLANNVVYDLKLHAATAAP
jgi:hypothetical protein